MYYKIIDNQAISSGATIQASLKNASVDTIIFGVTQGDGSNKYSITSADSAKVQIIKRTINKDEIIANVRLSDIFRYTELYGGNYIESSTSSFLQGFLDIGDTIIGIDDELVVNFSQGTVTLDSSPKLYVFGYLADNQSQQRKVFESFSLTGSASFKDVVSVLNFTDAAGTDFVITDGSRKQVIVNDKLGCMTLNVLTNTETFRLWSLIYNSEIPQDVTISTATSSNIFLKKVLVWV